ncbi:MAG TPA: hypothetical protein EYM84_07875 [Flavobacteriales bacterium]|nr:hypothetical protein [Flavobacteriales bacterium]HIN40175.1 hypothetical protein [Flavobacteriales bacterium]
MNYLNKYKAIILGIFLGALTGYLYFHFVGCANGTCSITSKPLNSTLYGAMMGGLLAISFKKDKTNANNNQES